MSGITVRLAHVAGAAVLLLAPLVVAQEAAAPEAPSYTHVEDVTISTGNAPSLFLDQNATLGQPVRRWQLVGNQFGFLIADLTGGVSPLSVSAGAPGASIAIAPSGNVGMGLGSGNTPAAPLHVKRSNGTAQVRVEEISTTIASRNMLRIINRGASTFRFDNSANASSWGFGSLGSGNFFVGSTPGQPLALTMTPAGNVTITGTLTQTSDRNAKRDIEPVDAQGVLARVAALAVPTWTYKADEQRARHIGPMAQDFAAAFGFGVDDTHVAPSDVAGVSLVAVQALNEKLEQQAAQKDAQIRALSERLAALEERLAR